MSKLTHERVNGIKTGFWSAAKKDDLVRKLGPIEKDFPMGRVASTARNVWREETVTKIVNSDA